MILNFVKLFPKTCNLLNIDEFYVNLDDVSYFKREYKKSAGFKTQVWLEDVIQIGNSTMKFPAIDDGLIILKSIVDAQNLIRQYNENCHHLKGEAKEFAEKEFSISKEFLSSCEMKYGTKFIPDASWK